MQSILQTRYYNLCEGNPVKYIVQTCSQAKSIKPMTNMKMKEVSQIKPRLGQGRAGLRCKIKTPIPINKPIAQAVEKQPKV